MLLLLLRSSLLTRINNRETTSSCLGSERPCGKERAGWAPSRKGWCCDPSGERIGSGQVPGACCLGLTQSALVKERAEAVRGPRLKETELGVWENQKKAWGLVLATSPHRLVTLASAGLSFPIYNQRVLPILLFCGWAPGSAFDFLPGKAWAHGSFRDLGLLLGSCGVSREVFSTSVLQFLHL